MMIGDEKAPPFSAKTLNIPIPSENPTDRIIALSRERYAQEREIVEEVVRKAAGLGIDNSPPVSGPPPKPKVQAQINQLDNIAKQESANHSLRLDGLLQN